MDEELFSVGLAHKACLAAEAQGYTPELLNTLAEDKNLFRQLLQVQLGHAEIKMIEHLIDFDAAPFTPDGWSVLPDSEQLPNRVRGKMKFDPTKVNLHLDDSLKNGKSTEGNKLRKKLKNLPVYGAQLLDYLLAHRTLILEEWKGKYVFFWGTIYRRSDGSLYVRYLYWDGVKWYWNNSWLGRGWDVSTPAALLAS